MTPPRRALISITSATAPLHEGHPTGVFIVEALHPFKVFTAAGFEVDIASEKGTYTPDWLSLQDNFLTPEDRKQYEDTDGEFRKKLDSGLTPDKLDADKASIFRRLQLERKVNNVVVWRLLCFRGPRCVD